MEDSSDVIAEPPLVQEQAPNEMGTDQTHEIPARETQDEEMENASSDNKENEALENGTNASMPVQNAEDGISGVQKAESMGTSDCTVSGGPALVDFEKVYTLGHLFNVLLVSMALMN